MKQRAFILVLALALCLGLCSCYEPPAPEPQPDENTPSEPVADMKVVSDGSLTAIVVEKSNDGMTLEITNSGNDNTVNCTFTSAKIAGPVRLWSWLSDGGVIGHLTRNSLDEIYHSPEAELIRDKTNCGNMRAIII